MIGPVTKHAILGVVFGVVALPIWGLLSGQFGLVPGLAGGFMGGLVGGTALGLGNKLAYWRTNY
jgi:hypothetical protein